METDQLDDWEIEENINIPEIIVNVAVAPEPKKSIEVASKSIEVASKSIEVASIGKKQRKTWKHVNACKTPVTGEKLVKLLYTYGMRELWTKKYKIQLSTWHAIGKKWQRMLDNLIRDIYIQMPRHKEVGDYACCAYEEGLEKPIISVYNKNIQRYPAHLKQVMSSLVDDIA